MPSKRHLCEDLSSILLPRTNFTRGGTGRPNPGAETLLLARTCPSLPPIPAGTLRPSSSPRSCAFEEGGSVSPATQIAPFHRSAHFATLFERFDVALCTLHVAHGSFGSHLDAPGARRGLPGPSHPRFGAHVARTATVGRSEARHVRTKRRRSVLICCREERGRGTRRTRRERCVLHGNTWAKPRGKSDNEPRKNRRRRTCTSGKDLAKRRNVRRCCAEHGTISVRTRPNELGRLRKDGRNTT